MRKKLRICQMMESYINDVESSYIDELYGKGTKIKIQDIFYSTTTNSIVIDCKVILGDVISEELLDTSPVEIFVSNAVGIFYPDKKLSITVSWDC